MKPTGCRVSKRAERGGFRWLIATGRLRRRHIGGANLLARRRWLRNDWAGYLTGDT
ncbi:hypothetical protein [Candidatus Palauibacter sp.]|uniref:hypothetical protein n=1 Tax=Candidatus Palauibacter sp. TaxID=3101350 RepID=UPI003B520990